MEHKHFHEVGKTSLRYCIGTNTFACGGKKKRRKWLHSIMHAGGSVPAKSSGLPDSRHCRRMVNTQTIFCHQLSGTFACFVKCTHARKSCGLCSLVNSRGPSPRFDKGSVFFWSWSCFILWLYYGAKRLQYCLFCFVQVYYRVPTISTPCDLTGPPW